MIIIGRTNFFAEKNLKKNLLTRNEYFYISHLAREFILENAICSLPVSLNDIIVKNKWKVITYSSLKKLKNLKYNEVMKNIYGFTIFVNNDFYICYDDALPVGTQRFTIAHEIGHIVLNHFSHSIENKEQEASMFAARILLPICVLYECKVRSANEIMELCSVSDISANYRFERLQMLTERQKFYKDDNEKLVYKRFKPFINNYLKEKFTNETL